MFWTIVFAIIAAPFVAGLIYALFAVCLYGLACVVDWWNNRNKKKESKKDVNDQEI